MSNPKKYASASLWEELRKLEEADRLKLLPEQPHCIECGSELVPKTLYTKFVKGKYLSKSEDYALIPKQVRGIYYFRRYCFECVNLKFNPLKKFNALSDQMAYALKIPEEIVLEEQKSIYTSASFASFIHRHGEVEGRKKYKEYCERQAETNGFEYKREILNWSEEDFEKYNQDRSVTLNNMIGRYGPEVGPTKWKEYLDKQANVFEKMNGEDNMEKLNNYLWNHLILKKDFFTELPSVIKLWRNLDLSNEEQCFWGPQTLEFFLLFKNIDGQTKSFYYDYAIPRLKLIVEYDDMGHISQKEAREKDSEKTEVALKNGFTLLRIDEKNLEEQPEKVLESVINFIKERIPKSQGSLNKIAQEVKIGTLL